MLESKNCCQFLTLVTLTAFLGVFIYGDPVKSQTIDNDRFNDNQINFAPPNNSINEADILNNLTTQTATFNTQLETTEKPLLIYPLAQHNHHDTQSDFREPVHDNQIFYFLLFDQLEYQVNDSQNLFNWDATGWVGGDYQKMVLKTEGYVNLGDGNGEAEIQILYSKLVLPYWDLQMGLRYEQLYGETDNSRGFVVIGMQGLAPYFVEVDGAIFISHQGDISARLKLESDLLLSQKLILTPKLETNLAIQQVEDFGVGSGFNDLELGLRLRYEVNRQFAPYIGVTWTKLFGDTAQFAEGEGESSNDLKFVGGVRLMF